MGFREQEIKIYENDEKMWNNTYRNELKNVNISLI